MRRIAVQLGVAGLAVAATAGLASAGPSRPANSGFHGVVYRGPTSPVCRSSDPCEAPAAGVTLRFARSGRLTRSVTTAPDGRYRILLPAAIYQVTTTARSPGKVPSPHKVKVRTAHVDRLDFHIDTGIR
jgi:hypothetical protein